MTQLLADGQHTAVVAVQNNQGQWSAPAETTFSTVNVPGASILLELAAGVDAALAWSYGENTGDYAIYRDGVQIGHASQTNFIDRLCIGAHAWFVIEKLPGGYYTKSNVVEAEISVDCPMIALLSGGTWLPLRCSEDRMRTENATEGRTVSIRHFAGLPYPVAEVSPYKTLKASFTVAWTHEARAQAEAFEAMTGLPVIYKTPTGELIVGVLSAVQRKTGKFIRAFSAAVQRIHWGDFVDADA